MSSSLTDPFSTPEGYHRLALANDNDHTAYIAIVTTLGLLYGLLFGAFRWFVRSTICPGVGIDDYLTGIATVLQVIQACVVLGACSTGLGRSPEIISTDDLVKSSKSYYSSTLFFLVAIGLTKISSVYFLKRLASRSVHSKVFTVSTAIIGIWTAGAFFTEALQCNLSYPWLVYGEQCTDSFTRWLGISIVDIITELVLVCLAVFLIWPLQAKLLVKANVIATFAIRLIIIIPIALRLKSLPSDRTATFPLSDSKYLLWTQTQLCYAIISATIPTLRPFANSMNTQFGGFGQEEGTYGYGHSKNSKNDGTRNQESFALKSMDASKDNGKNVAVSSGTTVTTQPLYMNSSKSKAGSFDSKESQQMIIRKETTFYVEHESEEGIERL